MALLLPRLLRVEGVVMSKKLRWSQGGASGMTPDVVATVWPDQPEMLDGHRLDGFCWCQPLAEDTGDGYVYVHRRSLDAPHKEPTATVDRARPR